MGNRSSPASTTTRRSIARITDLTASAATRRNSITTTLTTARRATALPIVTTSPERSTTTAGAGRWRGRFFFTAENVYKGNLGMVTMYSGRDRGNEVLNDGVNLRLPSGSHRANQWGNLDFDVNLIISDAATDPTGQYFFDIFTTDGFLGDIMLVNFQ